MDLDKNLALLLLLYGKESVILTDIASMAGVTERCANDIRNRLVEQGFLREDGGEYKRGGFLKFYRVNHKRLDEFLVKESPLFYFYRRIVKGHISVWPMIKPDEEKLRRWLENGLK